MDQSSEHARQKAQNDLVLSYLAVRRAIGLLGFFLPVALALYGLVLGGLLPSMSAYFYSPMREIFVGTLCAQAVFLWSYEGYREPGRLLTDRLVARIAALSAALIGFAPSRPDGPLPDGSCTLLQCMLGPGASANLHVLAVLGFFGALTVFCLVLFQRGTDDSPEGRAARRLYRICGWTIIAAIAAIGLLLFTGLDERLAALRPVFWLEAVACFAFATSWTVKGRFLRPVLRMMAGPRGQS